MNITYNDPFCIPLIGYGEATQPHQGDEETLNFTLLSCELNKHPLYKACSARYFVTTEPVSVVREVATRKKFLSVDLL